MRNISIEFQNVTFGYPSQVPLFTNFSLSLSNGSAGGRIVAIMGPSGIGKTTLCDLALGIQKPKQGRVKLDPNPPHIALIPQKGIIFDELTVRENVACLRYSKSLGRTFRQTKVDEAIGLLGLSKLLKNGTRAGVLSPGEAQRVMLARIHTIDCEILVLDEPCSFLDNQVKGWFLDALRETADRGSILTLFVTHVWEEANQVADEAVFLYPNANGGADAYPVPTSLARSCPPTIDALFSIHWPRCVVLDRAELKQMNYLGAATVPDSAKIAGVFDDNGDKSAGLLIKAEQIKKILQARPGWPLRDSARLPASLFRVDELRCVFYNQDGIEVGQCGADRKEYAHEEATNK